MRLQNKGEMAGIIVLFMRHKFPVLTVKKLLKSVSIYGSYRKNKTGVPFFWNTLYVNAYSEQHYLLSRYRLCHNAYLLPAVLISRLPLETAQVMQSQH